MLMIKNDQTVFFHQQHLYDSTKYKCGWPLGNPVWPWLNGPPILMDRCSHSGCRRSDMGVVGRSLFQEVTTWVGCPVFWIVLAAEAVRSYSLHLSTRYLPDFKSRFLQVPRISVQNARACLRKHWHLKQCHGRVQKHDNTPIIIGNPIRKQNHHI